jgi:RNA polymerase sigma-70 factor (ECF subfamily)
MSTDKETILRFKEGQPEAFDVIYRIHSKKMYYFALGLVKDQEISKDLVQEVFITLWEKRDQVNAELNFDNYLFTIAYNAIRKYFRNHSLENKVKDYMQRESPEIIAGTDGILIFKELLDLANKTIELLPPRRKAVYKLSKQEGMKIREIAVTLNISPRTAENHLAQALKYLKKELSENSFLALFFYYFFVM